MLASPILRGADSFPSTNLDFELLVKSQIDRNYLFNPALPVKDMAVQRADGS